MSSCLQTTLCTRVNGNYFKHVIINTQKRRISSIEILRNQNKIFNLEQKRQHDNVGRVEKIEVRYMGTPKDMTLKMNKNISTPHNVAQHISEGKCKSSVVAMIDNKKLWDLHRPLEDSCTVQLLNFKISDPAPVNKVFWRSCSFLLGAVMSKTFKEESGLKLHSFPPAFVRSGSFVHDIVLNEPNWEPSHSDLHTLTVGLHKMASSDVKIERLDVSLDIALDIFENNPFKSEHIPNIAAKNSDKTVSLYRVDDHIDISVGPMMSSTRFVGLSKIVASHKVSIENAPSNIYRVQGVALPVGFSMSSFAFNNILVPRARKLNQGRIGSKEEEAPEAHHMDVPFEKQKIAN